mgnify:FL=1|jgi:hypothetical protein
MGDSPFGWLTHACEDPFFFKEIYRGRLGGIYSVRKGSWVVRWTE